MERGPALCCNFTLKTPPTFYSFRCYQDLYADGEVKIIDNEHISFTRDKAKPFCVTI